MDSRPPTMELAPELEFPAEEREKGFWKKLKRGLRMTHTEMIEKISAAVEGRKVVDEETLEFLEEILISSDIGVEAALELVDTLRQDARAQEAVDVLKLRERLVDEVALMLLDAPRPAATGDAPTVTLVVGVNGVGKTTSIAKLAHREGSKGNKVLLAAADTFRAAAIEQLRKWGDRIGVDVIAQNQGADPAAVVYDAIQAAQARGCNQIFIDTAGRLHNKENLMNELAKIDRVVEREAKGWHRRTLLVLDATTGQNALNQARGFADVARVDAVLLAKLDGTAKGGMAVAVARELRLPVLYLGVGEGMEDLVEFHPREFASALLG